MVGDSEREDFRTAIVNARLDPSDFELIEREDPMRGPGIQPVTGTVTIRRKSNGSEKKYRAGHGSRWPAEFSDDLAGGVFGQ